MKVLRHFLRFGFALAGLAIVSQAPVRAQVAVFGFQSIPLATTTPLLAVTPDVGGPLTADFLSLGNGTAAEPDAFVVGENDQPGFPPLFTNMSGHLLIQPGALDTTGFDTLQIHFSAPILSLSLDFALVDVDALRLDAFAPGGPVGSVTVPGTLASSGFFEGMLSFDGGGQAFDRVDLLAANRVSQFFAIDNVTVLPSVLGVPEPGAVALGIAALAPFGLIRLRWRSRS